MKTNDLIHPKLQALIPKLELSENQERIFYKFETAGFSITYEVEGLGSDMNEYTVLVVIRTPLPCDDKPLKQIKRSIIPMNRYERVFLAERCEFLQESEKDEGRKRILDALEI